MSWGIGIYNYVTWARNGKTKKYKETIFSEVLNLLLILTLFEEGIVSFTM